MKFRQNFFFVVRNLNALVRNAMFLTVLVIISALFISSISWTWTARSSLPEFKPAFKVHKVYGSVIFDMITTPALFSALSGMLMSHVSWPMRLVASCRCARTMMTFGVRSTTWWRV
jgi:ABC-type anion transport system duplicated permease subunit